MKRIVERFLLAIGIITLAVFCFVGCGEDPEQEKAIKIPETLSLKVEEKYLIESEVIGEISDEFIWESSDTSVAEVNNGLVSAKKPGSCEITVKSGEISAKCAVSVSASEKKPTVITGVLNNEIGISVGGTYKLNSYMKYGGEKITEGITYQSYDTSIVEVSQSGEVVGVSFGQTIITVKGEYLGCVTIETINVTVSDSGLSVRLNTTNENLCIINNSYAQYPTEKELFVKVYNNDEDITNTVTVTWKVNETDGIKAVNIYGDGDKATITANGVGTCEVLASFTYNNHEYDAYCRVTVKKVEIISEKYLAEKDGESEAVVALPTEFGTDTIKSVLIDGESVDYEKRENNSLKIHVSNGQDVKIISDYIEFNGKVYIVTKKFKQSDVADFASIIEKNMDGYYVLEEDLDFTGITFKSIGGLNDKDDTVKVFTGTLDGNGHSITNLAITKRDYKDQYGVYKTGAGNMIASNSGIITDLYVKFTTPDINNYIGLIGDNSGNVNNVLVDITLIGNMTGNTSQLNGGIASRNVSSGTVKNCIVNINASGLSGTTQVFGGVVGVNYSGADYPIQQCYAITNGMTISYKTGELTGGTVLYGVSYNADTRRPKNCAVFTNVSSLADGITVDAEDGWSGFWKIEDSALKFNGIVYSESYLGKFEYDIVNDKSKVGFVKDLSEEIVGDIVSATLNDTSAEIFNGKTLTVPYATLKGLPVGVCTVELKTSTATYKIEIDRLSAVITLMQKDAENLQSIIEEDLTGEYVLGEDIDMTGVTFKSIGGVDSGSDIKAFTGSLDGRGFAIKNLTITGRDAKDQWGVYLYGASNFIANNSGTIKDIAFINLTMADRNNYVGIVGQNSGTINNLYADITLVNSMTGGYAQLNGGIVSRNNPGGTVKNCIVNIDASGLSGTTHVFGTVVGGNYSGAEYPIDNCYAITNGMTISYKTGELTGGTVLYSVSYNADTRRPKNSKNYDNASELLTEVTSLPSASGWSEYWAISNGSLTFGDEVVA